jgi:hypothetical protein
MSYLETLYKNALKTVEEIYVESKYNPKVDLYRSLDIMTAVNPSQTTSKQWLVENLKEFVNDETFLRDGPIEHVLVMGAWYGIAGLLMKEHLGKDVTVWNVDSDYQCEIYGPMLHKDIEHCQNIYWQHDDAIDYFIERSQNFQLIINTSCEHMEQEDIEMIIRLKKPNCIVCFQSNNFHNEAEHINTHNSIEEFEKSLGLTRVFWSGFTTPENAQYQRYMVIGI